MELFTLVLIWARRRTDGVTSVACFRGYSVCPPKGPNLVWQSAMDFLIVEKHHVLLPGQFRIFLSQSHGVEAVVPGPTHRHAIL